MKAANAQRSQPNQRRETRLRTVLLTTILLLLIQAGIGMAVNLYVTIPARHPGARPSNYLAGSFDGVVWIVGHGVVAVAIHAAFGLALAVLALAVAWYSFAARNRAASAWSILAGLLVIGAGFNGASFLDFNDNISSLIMALLAFGAIACYCVALFLVARRPAVSGSGPTG
jgi:heme A synthase